MCGLMGLVSRGRDARFAQAFDTIKPRGPDASSTLLATLGPWQVELGHHRLSVIDLMSGRQPMTVDKVTVVFNGEIYNHADLAAQIRSPLQTRSDTEVLLRLFTEMGERAFNRLEGFFSAGFINQATGEVTLVRDPWGIKPLYYAPLADGGLMFASELKPFLKVNSLRPKVSPRSFQHFLFWEHVPEDESMLEGVFKLKPGHYLRWRDGHLQVHGYTMVPELLSLPERARSSNEVWTGILESVEKAFTADVPVGILLSGGLDSSVLALAAHELKGAHLPTFSIGFSDPDFDESRYAESVAHLIKSEHVTKKLTADDLLERWQDITRDIDEPIADPSLIPTRILCELARESVKVVMGGDGGDELFGGYPTYIAHRYHSVLRSIPEGCLSPLRFLINHKLKMTDAYQPFAWKLKRLIGRFDQDPLRSHFRWMSVTDEPTLRELFASPVSPFPGGRPCPGTADPANPNTWLYCDLTHYLPYSVLTKVDRASMAVGLECRPPLLNHRLAELAFSLPWSQKVSGRETKVVIREILRARLPKALVDRPKRGFAIPLARWLKGPLRANVELMLKESSMFQPGLIREPTARGLWRDFLDSTGDHARTFWALLVMDQWLKHHAIEIEAGGAPAPRLNPKDRQP